MISAIRSRVGLGNVQALTRVLSEVLYSGKVVSIIERRLKLAQVPKQ